MSLEGEFSDASPALAIHGGEKTRPHPMPTRGALSDEEESLIAEVIAYYRDKPTDPGYQGVFEERYCNMFCDLLGGGWADSVATGTASLYVALQALELPKGSEVIVSPITDPGSMSAIILNGLSPALADANPGSYNISSDSVRAQITDRTSAIMVVHAAGQAADISGIMDLARAHNLRVIEDCSQAHGATSNETPLGTFGDVACFSTMYRKAHMTGGCGGVVYSRNRDLYHKALAYADRGKPRWLDDFDDRDPRGYLFPALNLHNDEISCAIGISSLRRLDQTISNRLDFVFRLTALLKERSRMCRVFEFSNADSPFFIPVQFDQSSATCTKTEFAEAVRAEGIDLNPHYQYLAADWPWLQPYAMGDLDCRNARAVLDTSFNIFVNENYSEKDALSVAEAIEKVERHYKR